MQRILLFIVLACASHLSRANEFSYSYLEAGYLKADIDSRLSNSLFPHDYDYDSNQGFNLSGAGEISDHLFLMGQYEQTKETYQIYFPQLSIIRDPVTGEILIIYTGPVSSDNVELTRWNLGIGFHTPLVDQVDFVAQASYERSDHKINTNRFYKADGFGLYVGIRSMYFKKIELDAGIKHLRLKNDFGLSQFTQAGNQTDSSTLLQIASRYNFTPNWSVALGAEFGDGDQRFFLGPRFSFD